MFHEMRRALTGIDGSNAGGGKRASKASGADRGQLLAELEGRSEHAQNVRKDVEKYGDTIREVARAISTLRPKNLEALAEFISSVDALLGALSDEAAVIKQLGGREFWPEAKMDTFRDAHGAYKTLMEEASKLRNWRPKPSAAAREEMARAEAALRHGERVVDRRRASLESDLPRWREHSIPWDDAPIKAVRRASLTTAREYMALALTEAARLESRGENDAEKEVLADVVRCVFRVHQFAGGFTSECLELFQRCSKRLRDLGTLSGDAAKA